MNRIWFFLILMAVGALEVFAADRGKLVWSDEFDQPDGSAPKSKNWVHDLGGDGWGNNELETYTDRRKNSRIENGMLVIEARQEKFSGKDGKEREFTSARLKTLGKQSWKYGRIEARMKLPRGQGIWPAFWMMGDDVKKAGWPNCGEIDVMENIGKEPTQVHGTVHGPGYSGAGGIGKAHTLPNGKAVSDDFHVFAIDWSENKITWLVDGNAYFTLTADKIPANKKWVFDHPHFILLNLAVGGHWPGKPDATTTFPQHLLVDYVRVYANEAVNR
ncbi:MAG TPA: glycoside hydrolase family 16 protein [Verrucomicrobiae bacterium]|nr:glycoside hydrolase family 16 protein [Verrucomicrobiae bacterium]